MYDVSLVLVTYFLNTGHLFKVNPHNLLKYFRVNIVPFKKCNVILIELYFLCLNQNFCGKETKY